LSLSARKGRARLEGCDRRVRRSELGRSDSDDDEPATGVENLAATELVGESRAGEVPLVDLVIRAVVEHPLLALLRLDASPQRAIGDNQLARDTQATASTRPGSSDSRTRSVIDGVYAGPCSERSTARATCSRERALTAELSARRQRSGVVTSQLSPRPVSTAG
jgi:hypothetical protein